MILASASPRRRDLLLRAGYEFEVEPAGVDESIDSELDPRTVACELARRKALAVARSHSGEPVWVLGSDTVVAVERADHWHRLGKPRDADEAGRFLGWLSDTRHQVLTGVCIVGPSGSAVEAERTWVRMRPITRNEIEAYVASGEWRDKAGGYAIQEHADAFVLSLEEGGFDNVVGLPLGLVAKLLEQTGY